MYAWAVIRILNITVTTIVTHLYSASADTKVHFVLISGLYSNRVALV